MNKLLLCVHIEKTAGTTFKPTVSDQFETAFDYGLNHHWTSQVVLDFWASGQQDLSFFADRGIEALFGHFLPEKYLRKDPDLPVLVWIRDPVQRLLSDFHFKGPQGDLSLTDQVSAQIRDGKLTFEDFIQHPSVSNTLSRYLAKVPDANFVFVGESEQYDDDLAHFGQLFNARFVSRPARNRATGAKHQITAHEQALLEQLHSKDFAQHKRMVQIKKALQKAPLPRHDGPPTDHSHTIWQEVAYSHEGQTLNLPQFLRNSWRVRPPEYRRKLGKDLHSEKDFELWYLYHGIHEFSPHSEVYADIVRRFTAGASRKMRKKRQKSGKNWLAVLERYPQAYRSYYLRSDLRRGHPIGKAQGVEAFLRWWDFHAEVPHGKDRQALSEMAAFNWEEVDLKQGNGKTRLPRLLRDTWLDRPDLQERFSLGSSSFRHDFESWYLLLGIKETSTNAPFDQGLLDRVFPKNTSNGNANGDGDGDDDGIDWFDRLKDAPDAFLIYLQRPDLRKNRPLGELAGVEVFLRWWDREAEKHFGKDRAGLALLPEFDREKVALSDGDTSHVVPRLWRDTWQARPDLQQAFPLTSPTFIRDFAKWYVDNGQHESNRSKRDV